MKPVPHADSAVMRDRPDAWLGKEITCYGNDRDKTYASGEGVNQLGGSQPLP